MSVVIELWNAGLEMDLKSSYHRGKSAKANGSGKMVAKKLTELARIMAKLLTRHQLYLKKLK